MPKSTSVALMHVALFSATVVAWGCSQLPEGSADTDDPIGGADAAAGGASLIPAGEQGGATTGGAGAAAGGSGGVAGQSGSGGVSLSTGGTSTGGTSPNTGGTSPNTGGTSPNTGGTSPNTGGASPNTGGVGGAANVCVPPRTTCSVNIRSVCDASGTTTTPCEFGCLTGTSDCRECATEGVIDCPSSTSTRTCTNGRWTSASACSDTKACVPNKGCVCSADQSSLAGKCYKTAGFNVPFDYLGSRAPGFLGVQRINFASAATIIGLGLLGQTGSGRARMALYKDAGGAPSTLVAETTAFEVFKGEVNVAATPMAAATAGAYWVGAVFETTGKVNQDFNTKIAYRTRAQSFTAAFPSTFGPGTDSMPPPFNFYVLIE